MFGVRLFIVITAIRRQELKSEYSSKERAKKAMEELRMAYMCHNLVKMGQTPPDGIDEKLTMGLSGVFEFPADEELE